MIFHFVTQKSTVPSRAENAVFLIYDNWDDYGYQTTFGLSVFDEAGTRHELPRFKIGFVGQTTADSTYTRFSAPFEELPKGFFSLCDRVEFYKTLSNDFSAEWRDTFLTSLKDLVYHPALLESVKDEDVVRTSLFRDVRIDEVKDQFSSVLRGEVLLTDFDFSFDLPQSENFAGFDLQFEVQANSLPSTNMHALIGRNGVGKTTYLNAMVKAVSPSSQTSATFYDNTGIFGRRRIDAVSYFGSLISVAFSAFDPFEQPPAPDGQEQGLQYSYIGLTDYSKTEQTSESKHLKTEAMLQQEFVEALGECFADKGRKVRWKQAVETLQSDENFADMKLLNLLEMSGESLREKSTSLIRKMSSGHTIVILTITLLVAKVNEKTLVLFDEPESHLQPPLLSALIRSLAQLLRARNAVAIIATHSPVVLQEIPKSCVWKVTRLRLASTKVRPELETFGENVGTLTRDVFGLDVVKSGFHTVLSDLVRAENPKDLDAYYAVLEKLGGKLGYEARGVLKSMILSHIEQNT